MPEGHFLHESELSSLPGLDVIGVYAAYGVSDSAYSEEAYPAGEYGVIFVSGGNERDVAVQIRGGIVRMDFLYPPTSPVEIIQRDASEFFLPPK